MDFYHDGDLGVWIASGTQAVETVLQHEALHVVAPPQGGEIFGRFMRMREGAYHHALKHAVLDAFAAFESSVDVARWCEDCADRFSGRTAQEWTFLFPVFVVARALGFRAAQALEIAGITSRFAQTFSDDAADELVAAVEKLLAEGTTPAPLLDPFARSARAAGIEPQAIAANAVGLLFQTHDATAALIRMALEERDEPPVRNTRRVAAADVNVLGRHVRAGAEVRVLWAGTPYAFGFGRHACPGERFARAIAAQAVRRLQQQED